jgi:transposase-like protein
VPAPHPPEFRRRAIELARVGGRPIAVVAKQLSISESCLRNWVAQADADERGSDSRLTSADNTSTDPTPWVSVLEGQAQDDGAAVSHCVTIGSPCVDCRIPLYGIKAPAAPARPVARSSSHV